MINNFPEFGKYLLDKNKNPSKWLNRKAGGKIIVEPINVLLADEISQTEEESKKLLINSLTSAGFKISWGHITPRYGIIENKVFKQLPDKIFHSFADKLFWKENNHGRFFGPHILEKVFYYIGAVSRETAVTHKYLSFLLARESFSSGLNDCTGFKMSGLFDAGNIINDGGEITGDHDGKAALLIAKKG
jgi:hypothetical protein